MEEELKKRQQDFLKNVAHRAEPDFKDEIYKDIQEHSDYLAFVSVASLHTSWLSIVQFVYSVQYFYPQSQIGIYDLGMSKNMSSKVMDCSSHTPLLYSMCNIEQQAYTSKSEIKFYKTFMSCIYTVFIFFYDYTDFMYIHLYMCACVCSA